MSALHIYGILIIAIGTVIGSYLIYLGNSKDSKKESDDLKRKIEKIVDINTINEEAQKYKPTIQIKTNHVNSQENTFYLDITIEAKNIQPKSIAFDYPLKGVVTNWNDLNSSTDAESSIIEIQGDTSGETVNNINVLIKDITLNRKVTFRFFYIPSFKNTKLGGRDVYETTYKWQYKGVDYSETEWRTIENDKVTEQPGFQITNITFTDHARTPEERKKNFEEGLKKRN